MSALLLKASSNVSQYNGINVNLPFYRGKRFMKSRISGKQFTLAELLIVIMIIFVLAGILLPTLAKSKQKALQTACSGLLRQYALATNCYVNDWKLYPDAQKYLQKETGFITYFDKNKETWPEQFTRCPGDEKTKELGRLAECVQETVSINVSIGVNGSNFSDSRSMRAGGPVVQWIRPEDLKNANPSKVSMWMDFQYQGPDYAAYGETYPLTSPVMVKAAANTLNRYAFRHNNAMNTTFHDGHVGTIRLLKSTINYGHDFASGQTWTAGQLPSHVRIPFGARPANAKMFPNGFPESPDVICN